MFGNTPWEVPSVTEPLIENADGEGVGSALTPVPDIGMVLGPLVWSPFTVSVPL